MAPQDITDFSALFVQLFNHTDSIKRTLRNPEPKITEKARLLFPPFAESLTLERALPSMAQNRLKWEFDIIRGPFLFLPLIGNDTQPLIAFSYDFSGKRPILRLKVVFAVLVSGQYKAFALRFETPEGEGDGLHDMYHAQFMHAFSSGADHDDRLSWSRWLPDSQPSFALDARTPIGLVIAALVSIYGMRFLDLMVGWPRVRSHCEDSGFWNLRPSYWQITPRNGRVRYVKTWERNEHKRRHLFQQEVGVGCRHEPAPAEVYYACRLTDRLTV